MDEYDIDHNEFYDLNRSLRNQANNLIRDYSKLKNIIKSSETASKRLSENLRPLEGKLYGLKNLTQKIFTSLLNSGSNKDILSGVLGKILAGGGRATGGNVVPGIPYVVGERGPEIFTPSSSGNIISHNSMSKNTKPINITMNITTPDIVSFQKSESQLLARISGAVRKSAR
jgi:hypothetical protein